MNVPAVVVISMTLRLPADSLVTTVSLSIFLIPMRSTTRNRSFSKRIGRTLPKKRRLSVNPPATYARQVTAPVYSTLYSRALRRKPNSETADAAKSATGPVFWLNPTVPAPLFRPPLDPITQPSPSKKPDSHPANHEVSWRQGAPIDVILESQFHCLVHSLTRYLCALLLRPLTCKSPNIVHRLLPARL
jgi:hypothetical protein